MYILFEPYIPSSFQWVGSESRRNGDLQPWGPAVCQNTGFALCGHKVLSLIMMSLFILWFLLALQPFLVVSDKNHGSKQPFRFLVKPTLQPAASGGALILPVTPDLLFSWDKAIATAVGWRRAWTVHSAGLGYFVPSCAPDPMCTHTHMWPPGIT